MHIPQERARAVVYHVAPFMISSEQNLMKFEAHAF